MSKIETPNFTTTKIDLNLRDDDDLLKLIYWPYEDKKTKTGCVSPFTKKVFNILWYSIMPIRHMAHTDKNSCEEYSIEISRHIDYLLNTWAKVKLPTITLRDSEDIYSNASIRFTRNFMHNFFKAVDFKTSDISFHKLDSEWHDIYMNYFITDATKRTEYSKKIGNIPEMIKPKRKGEPLGPNPNNTDLNNECLYLPFAFFYAAHRSNAYFRSGTPFTKINIDINTGNLKDYIILDPGHPDDDVTGSRKATFDDIIIWGSGGNTDLKIPLIEVWSHVACISENDRDVLAYQNEAYLYMVHEAITTSRWENTRQGSITGYSLKYQNPVSSVLFMMKNVTTKGEHSNYSTEPNYTGKSPLSTIQLNYESFNRYNAEMEYYNFIAPYYNGSLMPLDKNIGIINGSLDFTSQQPYGSLGIHAISDVKVQYSPSCFADNATKEKPCDQNGNPILDYSGNPSPQIFMHICRALVYKMIIRKKGAINYIRSVNEIPE